MEPFVYLIFSHSNVSQTLRLASKICLLSKTGKVVIHHDAKQQPIDLPSNLDRRISVIPHPVSVSWGDYTFVEAFLMSTQHVLEKHPFSWLVTLSGSDYPTASLKEFEKKLANSHADAFFRHFPVLDHPFWPADEGESRYCYSYLRLPRFRLSYRMPKPMHKHVRAVGKKLNSLQDFFRIVSAHRNRPAMIGIKRSLNSLRGMPLYGGMDWFNLSPRSVEEIHRFVAARPSFIDFYKNTILPSESFVHTILANRANLSLVNDACRYVNWGHDLGVASPGIFTEVDFDRLVGAGQPFARKFDSRVDAKILDKLDDWLRI